MTINVYSDESGVFDKEHNDFLFLPDSFFGKVTSAKYALENTFTKRIISVTERVKLLSSKPVKLVIVQKVTCFVHLTSIRSFAA